MKRIVIFASGSGSNAENIIRHFLAADKVKVEAVFCNRPNAGVIQKAKNLDITVHIFDKQQLSNGEVLRQVEAYSPDLVVLAGFLLLVPKHFIERFPRQIINIHPALLPKFGGAGMYGINVHNAVIASKEQETGITIHFVDEHYDNGDIISQHKVALNGSETCEEVMAKVHALEHHHFPAAIEQLLTSKPASE